MAALNSNALLWPPTAGKIGRDAGALQMRFLFTILMLIAAGGSQAQQVFRCLNLAQTELEYSDKPCPEGSSAARIDVTPNSAATAETLTLPNKGTGTAVAPPSPSGPVNNPFKEADEPAGDESNAWAKSNPKPEASRTFDQRNVPPSVPSRPSR